jgi:hypothetical protein
MNNDYLASRFHGALAFGHLYAAWFNYKRRNHLDTAIHLAFFFYDCASTVRHSKQSIEEQLNSITEENIHGEW